MRSGREEADDSGLGVTLYTVGLERKPERRYVFHRRRCFCIPLIHLERRRLPKLKQAEDSGAGDLRFPKPSR
jgi:hypothetical protein